MDFGVGLRAGLNIPFELQAEVSREAARLGYTSMWVTEGTGWDAFQLCVQRWAASRQVVPEGLTTGIAVSPVAYRTPVAFAMSAGTLTELTGGRFILGIGSGDAHRSGGLPSIGPRASTLSMMRDYLVTVRALLAGEVVDYEGETLTLRGARLGMDPPPRTPLYIGAMGPEMLRLAGELADGVAMNWCTPAQIAWSRERIAEGAARVGRDAESVKIAQYISVCVDDDVESARLALARGLLDAVTEFATVPRVPTERQRRLGYRAHFERMGFADVLTELDRRFERGASRDELANAFPDDMLRKVGYYGSTQGAREAFLTLAKGVDTAVAMVIPTQRGLDSVRAAMSACRPEAASPYHLHP